MIKRELLKQLLEKRDGSGDKSRWLDLLDDMINGNLLYYLKHIDKYKTKTIVAVKDKYGNAKSKYASYYITCGICSIQGKFDNNGLCPKCKDKVDYLVMLQDIDLHDAFDAIQ